MNFWGHDSQSGLRMRRAYMSGGKHDTNRSLKSKFYDVIQFIMPFFYFNFNFIYLFIYLFIYGGVR